MDRRPDRELEEPRGSRIERQREALEERQNRHAKRHGEAQDFWDNIGLDVDAMSPKAQVATSLAVLIPVAVGLVAVFALAQWLWWLIFVFGWVIFPAFGLLVRGVAGLSDGERRAAPSSEKELLAALREHGELTPAQAAMETSLSVAEADGMLRKLAEGGHLDVRVRGGGLFYALWEHEDEAFREP